MDRKDDLDIKRNLIIQTRAQQVLRQPTMAKQSRQFCKSSRINLGNTNKTQNKKLIFRRDTMRCTMAMSAEILYNAAHLHAIIAFEKAFNR